MWGKHTRKQDSMDSSFMQTCPPHQSLMELVCVSAVNFRVPFKSHFDFRRNRLKPTQKELSLKIAPWGAIIQGLNEPQKVETLASSFNYKTPFKISVSSEFADLLSLSCTLLGGCSGWAESERWCMTPYSPGALAGVTRKSWVMEQSFVACSFCSAFSLLSSLTWDFYQLVSRSNNLRICLCFRQRISDSPMFCTFSERSLLSCLQLL